MEKRQQNKNLSETVQQTTGGVNYHRHAVNYAEAHIESRTDSSEEGWGLGSYNAPIQHTSYSTEDNASFESLNYMDKCSDVKYRIKPTVTIHAFV